MQPDKQYGPGTILSHFGEDEKIKGAVVPPLFQNSLFVFDTPEALLDAMLKTPIGPPHHYSRVGNPTVDLAAKKIAKLEGTEHCVLTGTGQGAMAMVVMAHASAGAHILAVDSIYGPVKTLLADYLPRFGVTHTFVDGRDADELIDNIRPETTLVYLESPSSLIFRLQDIEKITKECRQRGIATCIDNTYSTPLYQQPAAMGVDYVMHSATKYMGGHSDITGGVICGPEAQINKMILSEINLLGGIMAPFPAWLLTRGLRTLKVRIKQHEIAGNEVASWIERQPQVERVHHIGLASYPQQELFRKQMSGTTGLFSFEPKCQDPFKLARFVEALELFGIGVSWGGFESLAVLLELQPTGYEKPVWIIRLFCGLEEPADLIADLESAMKTSEI